MQQQEVVSLVNSLLPAMAESSPEDVLIKAASDQDLSPAILQKMAQVFNTGTQLEQMSRASGEDRGRSIPQIDSVGLVERYVTDFPSVEKKASPQIYSTHDEDTLDLVSLIEFAPVPPQPTGEQVKAAAVAEEMPMRERLDALHTAWVEAEYDMIKSANELIAAVSSKTDGTILDLSEAHRDVVALSDPGMVKSAMDYLKDFAENWMFRRELILAAPHTFYKRAADLVTDQWTPHLGSFVVAYDRNREAFSELKKAAASAIGDQKVENLEEALKNLGGNDLLEDLQRLGDAGGGFPSPQPIPGSSGGIQIGGGFPSPQPIPGSSGGIQIGGETSSDTDTDTDTDTDSKEDKEKSDKKSPKDTKTDTNPSRKGPTKVPTAEKARQYVMATLGRSDKDTVNKPQMVSDRGVRDIRRMVMLQRLMATDDVLRHMPQDRVVASYNSLARTNPAIMDDRELLALALREAVDQGGFTLDAQKSLTGNLKSQIDGRQAYEQEELRRYIIPSTMNAARLPADVKDPSKK